MTKATFNGLDSVGVDDDTRIVGDLDDNMTKLRIRRTRGYETMWSSVWLDLRPEPTRDKSTSEIGDYAATIWPETGRFVLMGDPEVVILRLDDGTVEQRFDAGYVGKNSLELASVAVLDGGRALMACSTRVLWILDLELQPILRYEPTGFFDGPPAIEGRRLTVAERDLGRDPEVSRKTFDF